jgi:hypothetical protein
MEPSGRACGRARGCPRGGEWLIRMPEFGRCGRGQFQKFLQKVVAPANNRVGPRLVPHYIGSVDCYDHAIRADPAPPSLHGLNLLMASQKGIPDFEFGVLMTRTRSDCRCGTWIGIFALSPIRQRVQSRFSCPLARNSPKCERFNQATRWRRNSLFYRSKFSQLVFQPTVKMRKA